MTELFTKYSDIISEYLVSYGMNFLAAILILIVGFILSKSAQKFVKKLMDKSDKLDATLTSFISRTVKYVILIFTVLAVLDRFGVETASLITILGAASLAIGLALQGTLSNIAAGVMLLIFRPFKLGDFIEAGGQKGTVKSLGLFVTELCTPDNIQIIMPNNLIWGKSIINLSFHSTRRIDMVIGIGYDDDIDHAIAVTNEILTAETRVLQEPAVLVEVGNLGDSSVDLTVRAWVNASDFGKTRFALIKAVKLRFDKEKISFPYPQQDVHHYSEDK